MRLALSALPPSYSMLAASLLGHSWPLLPSISFLDLTKHLTRRRGNSGYVWASLTFLQTFFMKIYWVSIIYVTGCRMTKPAIILKYKRYKHSSGFVLCYSFFFFYIWFGKMCQTAVLYTTFKVRFIHINIQICLKTCANLT